VEEAAVVWYMSMEDIYVNHALGIASLHPVKIFLIYYHDEINNKMKCNST